MTREEVKKMLGEGATEEQVSAVLNMYQGEVNKAKTLQASLDKANAEKQELLGYKEEIDKINQSKMTEQEKLNAMQKEVEKNLKESKIIVNRAKAKEVLTGLDIDDDLISSLVSEDEEKTIKNANLLKNRMTTFEESITKKIQDDLVHSNLKPPATNKTTSSDAMTWEKFEKLSQEEQAKFAEENPDEFNNL